jgi:hypothetical protein
LANLNIEDIEIVQIKTGKAKPRTPRMYMQADDEALLLMETLKLKRPRIYTWQFSDKDVKHIKFNSRFLVHGREREKKTSDGFANFGS